VDGQKVVGEIKEKEEAMNAYFVPLSLSLCDLTYN
jgi:hypothetical protein